MWKPLSRDSYAAAITLFERALALEPASVEAQSLLAAALARIWPPREEPIDWPPRKLAFGDDSLADLGGVQVAVEK